MPTREQMMERHKRIAKPGDRNPLACMAIIEGPGRGKFFYLKEGFARIGRSASQEIQLPDDHFISREAQAIIGFVPERRVFFLFDGGKDNPVWINDEMVLDAASLRNEDVVKIGKTQFLFMAF